MNICLNKTGVALVLVLMIIVLSAGLLAAIMYYALSGSEISGLQRKYATSKEASLGALDIFTKDLIPNILQDQAKGLSGVAAELAQGAGIVSSMAPGTGVTNACFLSKLSSPTAGWTGCTSATNPDPTVSPDVVLKLQSASGGKPFEVRTKIIDTIFGNSNTSGLALTGTGVVESGLNEIAAQHYPYLYTITLQGQQENSTTERANFEVLYAY
jgi:hypothetical protein